MSVKANQYHIQTQPDGRKSPDINYSNHKHTASYHKSPYIGITLMEYFKITHSKEALQQIDEESNSSISAGTPCFHEGNQQPARGSQLGRRDKQRLQKQQQLLPYAKQDHEQSLPKVATINFEQIGLFDKNCIKLPSIHQHRHVNNSRQEMVKDGKLTNKKQSWKSKNQENSSHNNNSSLNKVQKIRIHQLQRNAIVMKKSIRARVTSTSFYHPNIKERDRERIKTEQQSLQKHLDKPFIVTKYGGISLGAKKSKEEIHLQTWKKNQNTFKLLKNNNG